MILSELKKKAKFGLAFLKKELVHCNLQILYECNFQCRICDFWQSPYTHAPKMTLDQIKSIEKKLNEIGPQIISIGGGEPLLHKDIIDMVNILSKNHFPVMICNGWYVTPEMAADLFSAGIYEISISVDYSDPARHDSQRGKEGAFQKAIDALKILNDHRVHPHQRVHMISVVMDDNIEEIEPLIQMCKNMGITYLVSLYSNNRGIKTARFPSDSVSDHLLALKKKYKEFVSLRGYLAEFSKAITDQGIGPCYAGKNLLNIDCRGNVTLCIDDLSGTVGNILTDDMGNIKKALLREYRNNDCKNCWTSCRGSIEAFLYGNGFLKNAYDYYQMTRRIKVKSFPC
jgi:MoaA/NifB/PqqE/SkfB family radical SAM enzyme